MTFRKVSVFIGAACAVICMFSLCAAQDSTNQANIKFKWVFAARSGAQGEKSVSAVTRDTLLKSGDEIKLFVYVIQKTFVYIIHKSSNTDLNLVFPYSLEMFDSGLTVDENYYIPKGRAWFTLDTITGEETFYILASPTRLIALEHKLKDFIHAENSQKVKAGDVVIKEIQDLKKQFRTFSTVAERPVVIAGNVRGTLTDTMHPRRLDIATLATEISAVNFYSKTITIDHK